MNVKSVLGVVFDQNRVLLIKRRDVPVWVFPGGGIDSGESGEGAIVREVFEETGLHIEVVRRIATYTGGKFIKPVHLYECKAVGGLLKPGSETLGAEYFPLNKLPSDMVPPFKEFIEDALKQIPPFEREVTSITVSLLIATLLRRPIWAIRFLLSRLGMHINT